MPVSEAQRRNKAYYEVWLVIINLRRDLEGGVGGNPTKIFTIIILKPSSSFHPHMSELPFISLLSLCRTVLQKSTAAWKGEGMSQDDFMKKDECIVLDENDLMIGQDNKYNCHRFNPSQVRILQSHIQSHHEAQCAHHLPDTRIYDTASWSLTSCLQCLSL